MTLVILIISCGFWSVLNARALERDRVVLSGGLADGKGNLNQVVKYFEHCRAATHGDQLDVGARGTLMCSWFVQLGEWRQEVG